MRALGQPEDPAQLRPVEGGKLTAEPQKEPRCGVDFEKLKQNRKMVHNSFQHSLNQGCSSGSWSYSGNLQQSSVYRQLIVLGDSHASTRDSAHDRPIMRLYLPQNASQ